MTCSVNAVLKPGELPNAIIYRYAAVDGDPAHQIPVVRVVPGDSDVLIAVAMGSLKPAEQLRYLHELIDVATQLTEEIAASAAMPIDAGADWQSERRLS
jgi:hypothetical protein